MDCTVADVKIPTFPCNHVAYGRKAITVSVGNDTEVTQVGPKRTFILVRKRSTLQACIILPLDSGVHFEAHLMVYLINNGHLQKLVRASIILRARGGRASAETVSAVFLSFSHRNFYFSHLLRAEEEEFWRWDSFRICDLPLICVSVEADVLLEIGAFGDFNFGSGSVECELDCGVWGGEGRRRADFDAGMDAGGLAATLSTASSTGSQKVGDRAGVSDQFPVGLRVLVVDDDPTCLMILEKMLRNCLYEVTTCSRAAAALSLLRKRRGGFDLVLSDVYMPDMDGFKLLEHIGLEMDLPVISERTFNLIAAIDCDYHNHGRLLSHPIITLIVKLPGIISHFPIKLDSSMMSVDDGKDVVMKGVTHGACDYLIKPVRIEAIKNIWQHVVRKRRNELKELEHSGSVEDSDRQKRTSDDADYASSAIEGSWRHPKRRKDGKEEEDEGEDREDSSATKKPRVVWSVDLHQQFVAAVNQLGIDKAVPKKILELMNVPGLTRENVASHLQKYRLYLRRLSPQQHPGGPNAPFIGAPEAPFGSVSPLDGFDLQALAVSSQIQSQCLPTLRSGLGRTASNTSMGMSTGCPINLFNSNGQIANSSQIRCGLPAQELNDRPLNLLHGLPTSIESKQLLHFNRAIHTFGNAGPQVGKVCLQRTQAARSHPQIQMQVDSLPQQQLRRQLLDEVAGTCVSGLSLPMGQQMLSTDIAGQILGRNGAIVNSRGILSPGGSCINSSSLNAVSQAPAVDFPINNGMEFQGSSFPTASTPGLPGLPSTGMFQEATATVGSLEGLNSGTGMKGPKDLVPNYNLLNELHQNIGHTYSSIPHANTIGSNPGLDCGHQKNGQGTDEGISRKGKGSPSAPDENENLQRVMHGQNNLAINNPFKSKVEGGPNMRCENMLLTEHFVQDDLINAIFRQTLLAKGADPMR
ncbi:hypothetical protein ACLOJK_017719 [Asimina triloba]